MKSFPATLMPQKRRPLWWIVAIVLLMLADIAAPSIWGLCVLHLLLMPLAWRFLHRRRIAGVTATQAAAVALAGLWHAMYGPILDPALFHGTWLSESGMQIVTGTKPLYFDPVRLWTFLALMAAGYFHVYLRGRLRLRLKHQQHLQQGVRRRSKEVARVNHALREEVARRQATQHRLDQSETTFQSIMDRMQLQVARKNAEGVFTYANDPFCNELGLRPIDVIGSTDAELYAPALAARYRADDLNVMITGQHVDKVEEHPGVDGRTGFVQVFKAPEYDQHGQCIGIQAIFWDVTEKHRGAIALQNSEARKRALFDAAGDAVLLVDDRDVIMEANPAAMNLLQAGGGRLVGRLLEDLIMPVPTGEQPKTTHAALRKKTMTWQTLPFSKRHLLRLRRGDGVAFDSEVSVHPIPLGERKGRAVIIRDITLQQQAFEAMRQAKAVAEEANRTKTQFMAGISHELRTPLGGIRGLTELLAAQTLPALARRYVTLIGQNTELLHDAIEDILDFSAIEAGRVAIDPAPTDLHETVGEAFACLAIRVADKPVRLCLSIDPQTPRQVIADTKRIRQIIVNLVGNAIKFTPQGLVSLRLEMLGEDVSPRKPVSATALKNQFLALPDPAEQDELDDAPMRVFQLTITDTGIGVAAEHQTRIFDAFEQADKGTNKQFGGTGLGLAIARGLAERMGGGIKLESQVGAGSCFRVQLRLRVADPADSTSVAGAASAASAAGPARAAGAGGGDRAAAQVTVVLAVDNEAVEAAITETLQHDGWTVLRPSQIAADTVEASQPIAWILTNQTAEAAWRVRARKSKDRVLWLTRTGEPTPRRAKNDDTVIIEPVTPDELRRWLVGQSLRQTAQTNEMATARTPGTAAHAANSFTRSGTPRAVDVHATVPLQAVTPYRLLVVDDSPTNRLVIHDQLVSAGHFVATADGGHEAISLCAQQTFDCILMDLQMPGMDGTEVTMEIVQQAQRLGLAMPPVIALTAHVTDQHRRMCRDAGMVGYVTKPIHMAPLLVEINRVVKLYPVAPEENQSPAVPQPAEPTGLIERAEPMPDGAGLSADEELVGESGNEWRERLAKHCGDDEATIASVCEAIAMEVPELIRRLDRAATDGNAKAFKTAAHTLKSCLRYIASPLHNQLASELEKQCSDAAWFGRLHRDLKSKSMQGAEVQQVQQLQTIAKSWVARVTAGQSNDKTPSPPSNLPLF